MTRTQNRANGAQQYASSLVALDLYSFRYLTVQLGISRPELLDLAAQVGRFYKPFTKQDKVRPFARKIKPRKKRLIDNPTGFLKVIQARIEARLLKRLVLPEHLLGGIRGKTIAQNAGRHFGAPYIVTIDIKNFFPSITPHQIYSVWNQTLNCSPEIA
jgi:hypothetical protein